MNNIFLQVINTSIIGSIIILLLLLIRFFLRNSSKKFSYLLWIILLIKLIFPFSFESKLNPLPAKFTDRVYLQEAEIEKDRGPVIQEVSQAPNKNLQGEGENQGARKEEQSTDYQLPGPNKNQNTKINLLSHIWLAGTLIFIGRGMVASRRLKASLENSTYLYKNIYENAHIKTAFIHGLIRPKIYVPSFLSENERRYIIVHEETHLRRCDHLVKFLYFLVLAIHWFNPLIWLGFYLMEKDMELSCDEGVMEQIGREKKEDYSRTLLALATGAKTRLVTPLAFSENNTKDRVKNILNYKTPKFWVSLVLIFILVITGFFIFSKPKTPGLQVNISEGMEDEYGLYNKIFEDPREAVDIILEREVERVKEYTRQDINIEEAQVTNFKWLYHYEDYLDMPIEVFDFAYRIEGKELLDYPFTDIHPDGSLTEEGLGTGRPLLAFAIVDYKDYRNGTYILPKYEFLGFIYYGELYSNTKAEIEIGLIELLENLGLKEYGTFPGDHILVEYKLRQGETYKLLLSQPAKSGQEGIWCVDRWMDNNGNLYHPIIKGKLSLKEYYGQIQDQVDGGQDLDLLKGEEVALNFVRDYLNIDYAKDYSFPFKKDASVEDFLVKPVNEYYGYIMELVEYDWSDSLFIHFDKLEYLHSVKAEDVERLKELGVDPDELNNGYHIHNPSSYPETFKIEEDTKFYLIDYSNVSQMEVSLEEFIEFYEENQDTLFMVEDSGSKLRKLAQVYLP